MQEAIKTLKSAEHLLSTTFPLLKDPKILLGVLDNIYRAMVRGMNITIGEEGTFNERFHRLQDQKIESKYLSLLWDLHELKTMHKKSPMEFQRGSKFIICDTEYNMKTLNAKDLKEHLQKAKHFLSRLTWVEREE